MAASQNFGKKGEKRKAKNPVSNAPVAPPEVPAKKICLENCPARGCFVVRNIPKPEVKRSKTFNYKKYGGETEAHNAALKYMAGFSE